MAGNAPEDIAVINIVGATATGKSDLALSLAQVLDGEIINADSMQFYRGMDIGTAKLGVSQRRGITHHLLDFLEVTEEASVSDFQYRARGAIAEIRRRGRHPILVGGSGLYVRAATDHFAFPGTDPVLRRRLEAIAQRDSAGSLHTLLAELDPETATKIRPHDERRVVRALEVIALTGDTFSSELPAYSHWTPTVQIGLAQDRAVLHSRIAERVRIMWAQGWVEEVERLLRAGLRHSPTASFAIGYRQIIDMLDGNISEEQAQESTIVRTRQFAKRQETWFRRDPRIRWFDADSPTLPLDIAEYAQRPGQRGFGNGSQ